MPFSYVQISIIRLTIECLATLPSATLTILLITIGIFNVDVVSNELESLS